MDIGLDCYISGHSGFCGQLKNFCEDFQVTEIDESGHEVKLTQAVHPVLAKDVNIQHRKVLPKDNSSTTPTTDEHGHGKLSNINKKSSLCSINKHFYKLADITSSVRIQSALDKLTDFLEGNKMAKLQEMSGSIHSSVDCLDLGCFNNKNDRAIIHLNTRMVYPAIKTETIQQAGKNTITASIDHVFLEFLALFNNKSTAESLMRFCYCIEKDTLMSYDLPYCEDKDSRTKIHRLFAKHFGSFLESKTFTAEKQSDVKKKSCIQIRIRQKKGSRQATNQRLDEGKPSGNRREKDTIIYTGFVMKKENMETLEAIGRLSKSIGTYPSAFSFAGLKDKKAVTLQKVVVKGITPEQLSEANSNPTLSNITIGNYRTEQKHMEKGQHRGNAFRIILRDIHLNSKLRLDTCSNPIHMNYIHRCKDAINKNVNEAVDNIKAYGFINYFGQQRFGPGDGVTGADEIGLAMIQGNMVKAVQSLLKPSSKKDETNDAKRYYQETGDIPGTLSRMPHDRTRECLILKSLHRHGDDNDGCTKAFFNIPYSMRLLYAHSYVSLLWNKMVSYRLKEYGVSGVVVGDLIHGCHSTSSHSAGHETTVHVPQAEQRDQDCTSTASSETTQTRHETTKDKKTTHLDSAVSVQQDITSNIDKAQVKVVTEEDVRIGKYTIRDLVLPRPGYNVLYPTNSVKERYEEELEKDGLTNKNFRLRSLGMTLPGAYRKVVAFPMDVEWKWIDDNSRTPAVDDTKISTSGISYPLEINETKSRDSLSDQCIEHPKETIACVITEKVRERNDTSMSQLDSNRSINDSIERSYAPCGKRIKLDSDSHCIGNNLEISFKLQPSCYATVCLREMMKS